MSERNRKDVDADIPDSIKQDVEFRFVKTIRDALEIVWGKDVWSDTRGDVVGGKARSEARL
jgi:ATP-dependent Lon protease